MNKVNVENEAVWCAENEDYSSEEEHEWWNNLRKKRNLFIKVFSRVSLRDGKARLSDPTYDEEETVELASDDRKTDTESSDNEKMLVQPNDKVLTVEDNHTTSNEEPEEPIVENIFTKKPIKRKRKRVSSVKLKSTKKRKTNTIKLTVTVQNDDEETPPVHSPLDETQLHSPLDETQPHSPLDETQPHSPLDETLDTVSGLTLPKGWSMERRRRSSGRTKGRIDRYWYSPSGQKFRSIVSIKRFLGLV